MLILEKLRNVYMSVAGEQDDFSTNGNGNGDVAATSDTYSAEEPELPPLQVIYGLDQLNAVINDFLSQDERLGKLALNTHSRSDAERGQMLDIARKLAQEMQCQVEVEDLPDEYTVWLYGSRRQIGALMRELAARDS